MFKKKLFEACLNSDLKESIKAMEKSWKIIDNGEKDYHWDLHWSELNADINAAEINKEITVEEARYLREKYLRMEFTD